MSTLGDNFFFAKTSTEDESEATTMLTLGVTYYVNMRTPQLNKHRIRFVYGGKTDASTIKNTPIMVLHTSFTTYPTLNFADIFPSNSRYVSAKAILDSYHSSGAYIGSVEKNITLVFPDTVAYRPTFNVSFARFMNFADHNISGRVADLVSGYSASDKWLCFTNIMSLQAAITGATGKKNATIAKALLGISGWQGNVTKTGNASEYTINSGTFTIDGEDRTPYVTVTDSRGLSTTTNGTHLCVRVWERPSVSVSNIRRDNTSVSFDVAKTYTESFDDVNGEAHDLSDITTPTVPLLSPTLQVLYKASGNNSYTTLSGVSISDVSITIPGLNKQRAYDIRIILTDYIGDSTTYDFAVTSAQTDMHMRNAHIRFGGYINAEGDPLKEDPCFDCDWNAFFAQGIYIKDSNGDWHDIVPILRGLIPNE